MIWRETSPQYFSVCCQLSPEGAVQALCRPWSVQHNSLGGFFPSCLDSRIIQAINRECYMQSWHKQACEVASHS